jgi:hypothetical protein
MHSLGMGRILKYIEDKGEGKYLCYKTNKVSYEPSEVDVLDYDDKPASTRSTSVIAESDLTRVHTVRIPQMLIDYSRPIFTYFLDGSRHVYKVDDIAIGKKIFPVLAGQIVVGCCERRNRDDFKPYDKIFPKVVIAFPDDFDIDDEGENYCRLYCEGINHELQQLPFIRQSGIKVDKILLYRTDKKDKLNSDKDNYKNRGTAKIQSEMTDEEQCLVTKLCRENRLDDEHYMIKDGSLEYNPSYSSANQKEKIMTRENYRYVVGVSKSFDPELIPDFEGHRLSRTIASLNPYERTKAYRYTSEINGVQYAVWYLRLRSSNFRETHFSDVVKCEMVIINEDDQIDTDLVNTISANLIKEAYPVCFGNDSRWANHLYPVYLTETFCKSKYYSNDIILNLF